MKTENAIQYVLWGAGLYLVYQIMKQVGSVGKTAADIGSQIAEVGDTTADPTGDTFATWYDPTQRTVFFYWLTFPDGNHHMVWASQVGTDGTFLYDDGNTYRIGTDKAGGLRAYYYNG